MYCGHLCKHLWSSSEPWFCFNWRPEMASGTCWNFCLLVRPLYCLGVRTLIILVHCCTHSWRFMGLSGIAEMQRPRPSFPWRWRNTLVWIWVPAKPARCSAPPSKTVQRQVTATIRATLWPLKLTPNFITKYVLQTAVDVVSNARGRGPQFINTRKYIDSHTKFQIPINASSQMEKKKLFQIKCKSQ